MRAPSAYILFCKQHRPALVKKGLSTTEIAKECGRLWRELDATKKQALLAEAKKQTGAIQQKRQKAEQRKPKKVSPYAQFVKDNYTKAKSQLSSDCSAVDVMRKLAKMWKESHSK